MPGHIILLGDSIFDNAVYVPGGPSVIEHVRRPLPADWRATLLAVDGDRVPDVFSQLDAIPGDATHLVLSIGGNDALWAAGDLMRLPAHDVHEALGYVAASGREFALNYRRLIDALLERRLPLTLCTIYDSVPGLGPAEQAGLCVFNDVITRTASAVGAALIDLRTICNEPTDYAPISPIEPSATGGGKIARAIVSIVAG